MHRIMIAALLLSALPAAAQTRTPLEALIGPPIAAGDLGQARARGAVEVPLSTSAATQNGNSVGANSMTGTNSIAGSLSGNAGITTVFQNSGNNALFQNSTTLNITIR